MRKKTPTQNQTVDQLTGLQQDSLASVRGGTGPSADPGNEIGPVIDPGNEMRGHIVVIG